MRRQLSQGIRIYFHDHGNCISRFNYNFWQGMRQITIIKTLCPTLAVGCEGGAMAIHFRWA